MKLSQADLTQLRQWLFPRIPTAQDLYAVYHSYKAKKLFQCM